MQTTRDAKLLGKSDSVGFGRASADNRVTKKMIENRVIGLDVGDKRIGVSISDASRLLAAPLETVRRKNMKTDVVRITDLVRKLGVAEIVIGLPRNMDGTEGEQALKARSFAKQLTRATGLPVHFEDERLSTFSAIENLVARGIKTGHNKDLIDMEAAAIILQSFLDRVHNKA